MESSWHSYPSIFSLGHRAIRDLFEDDVTVEEKVDGSQFSFGYFNGIGVPDGPELRFRSKGAQIDNVAPDKMFARGVAAVQALHEERGLHPGWTYRGEYLQKPKHNALAYDRIPNNHVILFDINPGYEHYLSYDDKAREAARLGLEVVPLLYSGRITEAAFVHTLMDRISILGGQKMEGLVVKNYNRFGPDKHALMGKYVSEAFKEVHGGEWRKANPSRSDIIDQLIMQYRTPARWNKAVQHLREAGALTDTPKDIPLVIKEVGADIVKECADDIRAALYKYFMPQIIRGAHAGVAEHYKAMLCDMQFQPHTEEPHA